MVVHLKDTVAHSSRDCMYIALVYCKYSQNIVAPLGSYWPVVGVVGHTGLNFP